MHQFGFRALQSVIYVLIWRTRRWAHGGCEPGRICNPRFIAGAEAVAYTMALKATVHKADVSISDLDRNYYHDPIVDAGETLDWVIDQRTTARLVAFALNASERLEFGRGN